MDLGVARDGHHHAGGAGDPPEPVGDRRRRPGQRALRSREHLVRSLEVQPRVVAQRGEGRRRGPFVPRTRPPSSTNSASMRAISASPVAWISSGVEVQRRVDADPVPVGLAAAGQVHEPGPVLRAGDAARPPARASRGSGGTRGSRRRARAAVDASRKRRRSASGQSACSSAAGAGELPVLRRRRLEVRQHVEDALDRLVHGDEAIGRRLPQVRAHLVEVAPDAAPALDQGPAVIRRADRLVVDEVEEARPSGRRADPRSIRACAFGARPHGRSLSSMSIWRVTRSMDVKPSAGIALASAATSSSQPDPGVDRRRRHLLQPVVEPAVADDRRPRGVRGEVAVPEPIGKGAQRLAGGRRLGGHRAGC